MHCAVNYFNPQLKIFLHKLYLPLVSLRDRVAAMITMATMTNNERTSKIISPFSRNDLRPHHDLLNVVLETTDAMCLKLTIILSNFKVN